MRLYRIVVGKIKDGKYKIKDLHCLEDGKE
jgi:hypothetical protein